MKAINIVGDRYGRLVVLELVRRTRNHKFFDCICDCGKRTVVCQSNLRSGYTASCGCLRIEQGTARLLKWERVKFAPGISSCNYLWNRYKQGAKQRDLPFEANKVDFRIITSQPCHYCGAPPSRVVKGPRSNGPYTWNGIDRIDSDLGYIAGNMVPCCSICNRAKGTSSYAEFIEWTQRLRNKSA